MIGYFVVVIDHKITIQSKFAGNDADCDYRIQTLTGYIFFSQYNVAPAICGCDKLEIVDHDRPMKSLSELTSLGPATN